MTSVERPNIILIMTDDQGWYDVGYNGNTDIKTPNIDRLAKEGIIFNRFYSASAVCSPTRASVITGRNPLRINIPHANTGHMKDEEITLPEILKEHDYTTGHFGKWHLGTLTKVEKDANRGGRLENDKHFSIPSMHGYDTFFCTESKVPTYDPMIFPTSFAAGESLRFGWKAIVDRDSSKQYGTAYWTGVEEKATENLNGDNSKIIMDRTIPFIEKSVDASQPFFTTVWMHTPHLPVVSDSMHRNYYKSLDLQKRLYYGTITAMDEQVGRLWTKLEELGVQDETMIWFCSDNGPEDGTPGSAGKYRARKRSLYEGGVRVPAFMIWKDNIEGGRSIDFPAVTSDYLPTILDMLRISYPNRPLDGTSLLGAMQDEQKVREKAIGFLFQKQISWVDDSYKLYSKDNGQTFELYNLKTDESETNNLFQDHPEIVEKMKRDLNSWLESVEESKIGEDYN